MCDIDYNTHDVDFNWKDMTKKKYAHLWDCKRSDPPTIWGNEGLIGWTVTIWMASPSSLNSMPFNCSVLPSSGLVDKCV